jgi:hypothetical protein
MSCVFWPLIVRLAVLEGGTLAIFNTVLIRYGANVISRLCYTCIITSRNVLHGVERLRYRYGTVRYVATCQLSVSVLCVPVWRSRHRKFYGVVLVLRVL